MKEDAVLFYCNYESSQNGLRLHINLKMSINIFTIYTNGFKRTPQSKNYECVHGNIQTRGSCEH